MIIANATPKAFQTRRSFGLVALVAMLAILFSTFVSSPASAATPRFDDVPRKHQFHADISWLAGNGITTGYSDGNFRPREAVSREAFAAFLYRLAGKPRIAFPTKSPFKDVKTSDQFYQEIVWLSQQGITTGWADGTFRPKDKISREAVAAFLYRYEGKPSFSPPSKSPFKDMRPSSKFFKEVTWLSKTGMTTGFADGSFRPKANVSREAIAAFLHRGNTVARGDGDHVVGKDIMPGTYQAVLVPAQLTYYCSWERRDHNQGQFTQVLRRGHATKPTVEILATDTHFRTRGCSGWMRID